MARRRSGKLRSSPPSSHIIWVTSDGILVGIYSSRPLRNSRESASRKTRGKSGVDAVSVLALISHPKSTLLARQRDPTIVSTAEPLSTVLVLQFRPPVNAICVELPAGLIDAEEDAAKAGERELYEETGYKGTTEEVSPVIVSDPGMTSANMQISTVEVELSEDEDMAEPIQHLDEGEYIEKRIVAMKELYQTLIDYDKLGYSIDARCVCLLSMRKGLTMIIADL